MQKHFNKLCVCDYKDEITRQKTLLELANMDLEGLVKQTKYSKEEITGYCLFDSLVPKGVDRELFYKDLFSLIDQTKKVKKLHDKYFSEIENSRQTELDRRGVTPIQVRLNRIDTISQLQKSAINQLKNISETSNMYDSIYHTASSSLSKIVENLESVKNKLESFATEEDIHCHNLTQELSQIISEIRTLYTNTLFQEQQIVHDKDLYD